MASWKVTTRNVNKGVAQPVVVRYSHVGATGKSEDWFVPVGLSIDPVLLKNERVTGDSTAPELNERIQRVVTRLERAVRAASNGGQQPYKKAIQVEYASLKELPAKAKRLIADIKASDQTELGKLEVEIEQLLAQVDEKRAKVVEIKKRQGTYQTELLSTLIDQYVQHRLDWRRHEQTPG